METSGITHIQKVHNIWLQILDFHKQEIKTIKNQLYGIAGRNNQRNLLNNVERYENQLRNQVEYIDTLYGDIQSNNTQVKKTGNEGQGNVQRSFDVLITQHNKLKERFMAEEKAFNNFKQDIRHFAEECV